tara:strand:+ start:9605 stop:10582 length:978 start_codon:yes stop_codon:yes gene_type:complete
MKKIFITGGAGYVGSVLIPILLEKNFQVISYDLMIYGQTLPENDNLKIVKGDIRNQELLEKNISGSDIVIHLACISNDPSFELNPKLGKSINLDAFEPLVKISKKNNVQRFIYASSSSVYGIKKDKNVYEDMTLEPLTDYSKFKADCEKILYKHSSSDFVTTVIRPATVCGYSKRQRLDLVVNILTNLGYHNKLIKVLGGSQLRPNIHIYDMCMSYLKVMEVPKDLVNKQAFNVGFENHSVLDLAKLVKQNLDETVKIMQMESNDQRSYHVSSEKIRKLLHFNPSKNIEDAVKDLINAFSKNIFSDTLNNQFYYNIKRMNNINLT